MDINNFGPCNPATWGTVSDWVMTGVTALTAIFLWLTLRSQRQVQKDQQVITQIEQFNHRRQLLPTFKLQASTYSVDKQQLEVTVKFVLTVLENSAHNIIVGFNPSGNWKIVLKPGNIGVMNKQEKKTFYGIITFAATEFHEGKVAFTFEFSDSFTTRYRQTIDYLCFDIDHHISYQLPEIIKTSSKLSVDSSQAL